MSDPGLQRVFDHLAATLARDSLVTETLNNLREHLQVDRVVLYYFYHQWKGRVTFESLSAEEFSIFGSTGPDKCFNDQYAALYQAGRVRAIPDIEAEPITECHRDFLRNLQVRANLAIPILTKKGLWGLLIAHNCQDTRSWSQVNVEAMEKGAKNLANSPVVLGS
ncbi:GAF domain-containing protein [Lyngbya aestuarii]|uniref:GAF domain-containing protein n=1 Tax=Lyngbya aestuarii TaxID=118322 RepID=UPI00403D61A3